MMYRRLFIYRLVLWNIDLTLVDVARVSRDAYADAFRRVTGRPLVALPQMAGKSDSEIFFESLALNEASADTAGAAGDAAADAARDVGPAGDPGAANLELLGRYTAQLAAAFEVRHKLLASRGRALPGAVAAVTAVAGLPGVVQSVLTGTIRPNAAVKLAVFGLSRYIDVDIGGYGSEIYPMGAQLLRIRGRAAEKYGTTFDAHNTVYLADSSRDVVAAGIGGARCIGVASGRATAGELRDAGADVVLTDLADTAVVVGAIDRLTSSVTAPG
jgi:phosphoglycolate phosphatase-like HAD superfamily hydrolase